MRAFLFLLRESGIGLEATAAAGFVGAHGADDDQLFAFDQALGVNRGIAAADADREQFGDFSGGIAAGLWLREQPARHREFLLQNSGRQRLSQSHCRTAGKTRRRIERSRHTQSNVEIFLVET